MHSARTPFIVALAIGLLCHNASAANRLFLARQGEHEIAATSGPTTVYMFEDDVVTIEIWFESDGADGLSGYFIEMFYLATPTTGIGTVEYVDNPPVGAQGDSIFVDVDHPQFAFAGDIGSGPFYGEDGTRFYLSASAPVCIPAAVVGLTYWGEFQLHSSGQSHGEYVFDYQGFTPGVDTIALAGDCNNFLPIAEYQPLNIVVIDCFGDSYCCADGNCHACSAYYCDISESGAPCQGQPDCICAVEPRMFGDAGGNGGACQANDSVNMHDANHVWRAFQGANACDQEDGNPENADVGGNGGTCAKSGTVNLHDANHVWGVFQGINPCSAMCSSGPSPVMDDWQPGYTDSADITLVADTRKARPGNVIAVDVMIDQPLEDLQGFQLEALATGGTRGQLELIDIAIEPRRDYVFARTGIDQSGANLNRGVVGAILPSAGLEGIATRADGYLATFTYQVSPDALGTFVVDLNDWHDRDQFAQESFLTSSYFGMVEISSTTPAVVVVSNARAIGAK